MKRSPEAGDADAAASCSANVSAKDYGEYAGKAVVYGVLPTCEQLVRRDKIMTATRAIAATALFAGLAVGTSSTAWADTPTMNGHYIKTETTQDNAQTATTDWYFTPCGDGCANVTSSTAAQGSEAHFVNGQWTMDQPGGTTSCPDGTNHPGTTNAHYTWDPNTLTGTAQVTVTAAVCGFPTGYTETNNIQLRQTA